jgi:FtsP/CotA-like multicopper oxidase with cupredoxin domain
MEVEMNSNCFGTAVNPAQASAGKRIDEQRRRLLLGAAGVSLAQLAGCGGGGASMMMGAGATAPLVEPVAGVAAERGLPIIRQDPGLADGVGGRLFELAARRGSAQVLSGVNTPTLGYNGAMLGPALRLRTGERTTLRVRNELDETTTTHWHGLVVPAEVDGGPHQPIAPGATWEASFTVSNPASTCWFHPHGHGSTGRQVVAGLAGLLIVDDGSVAPGVLPDDWGVDDLALVLQDKRLTADGRIDYTLSASDQLIGYTGDRLLVNGVMGPTWRAPGQWVRWRLLNGCNARSLALRLSDATPMLQIANEGGLLAAPVPRGTLTLAPGERAEVLVDFGNAAAGQVTRLLASAVNAGMGMMGMSMMGMGAGSANEVTALTVRVDLPRQPGAISSAPARLPSAPALSVGPGATLRTFTLGGGMMGSPFSINGRLFDAGRVDLAVPAGAVEIWRFVNHTGMAHPMHVHGVWMALLSRDGNAPAAHERGLRDTFVVEAMQTLSVAVQAPTTASAVPLMFHCHILEHEDAGMMGQFVVA